METERSNSITVKKYAQDGAAYIRSIPMRAYLWLVVHLLLIRVFADYHDPRPVVFHRYGWPYALFLLGLLVIGTVGCVILSRSVLLVDFPARRLKRLRLIPQFRLIVYAVGLFALAAIWLPELPAELTEIQQWLFTCYSTIAALIATYSVLHWRGRDRAVPFRLWAVMAGLICFVALVIAVSHLDTFPRLNTIDELHNWSAQWTFAHTGLLGEAMYRQMIPLPQPILDSPHYFMGFMLRFFGDTLWQSRFARMLLACLALPFIYLCGKCMYGRQTGVWAVVVAALLIPSTSFVRPDVFVGVMFSVALYVYWRAQNTRRPWMHYLTGLLVALAGEGHPLAYRFGLAFALIYVIRWVYEMRTSRRIFLDGRIVALGLGGFTGMLIYLSIHILPNTEQGLHFAINQSVGVTKTLASRLENAWKMLLGQLDVWFTFSPFEFIFVALGTMLAYRQNKQADRLLLTVLVVSEILMLATYGFYRQFYQVHYLPVFALLGGRLLATLGNQKDISGKSSAFALSMMVFIAGLFSMVHSVRAAEDDSMRAEFTYIGQQLKADLPANAIVVGNEDYFLEYRSMNYFGIQTITTPNWYLVNYQGYKLWEVTKPDIFILSSEIDIAKYTDLASIYRYMNDYNFKLVRCYTKTGLIQARVYVRELPVGWTDNPFCPITYLNTSDYLDRYALNQVAISTAIPTSIKPSVGLVSGKANVEQ